MDGDAVSSLSCLTPFFRCTLVTSKKSGVKVTTTSFRVDKVSKPRTLKDNGDDFKNDPLSHVFLSGFWSLFMFFSQKT